MDKIKLSTGVVLACRKVPPYVLSVVHKVVSEPAFPYIEERSAAGGSEKQPALEGTPQFQQYREEMRKYRRRLTELTMQFYINYGVVGWWLTEDGEYHTQVPDDWAVDEVLQMYGETTAAEPALRRFQYISYTLLENNEDAELAEIAIGAHVSSDEQPVTKEEVQAAISPFESGTRGNVQ